MKIDTTSWKTYRCSDLFGNAKLGRYHSPYTLYYDENGYEYICASNTNNGLNKEMPKVNGDSLNLTPDHIISWGKQCPYFTYHQGPCVTSQGMYYVEVKNLSKNQAIFVTTILNRMCGGNYGYNNCLIGSEFDELMIPLPSTPSGTPDWVYMETYMQKMLDNAEESLRILRQPVRRRTMIDMCEWKSFRMADFFEISHGTRLTKEWRIPGNIPLVTAGEQNHGVAEYIGNSEMKVYSNAITVDMFGNCFFHSGDCVGDDNIYFFINNDISDLAKIFISVVINRNHLNKFSFHRQFRMPDAVSLSVLLPSISSGTPDWEYMDSYMRKVLQSARNELSALEECVA